MSVAGSDSSSLELEAAIQEILNASFVGGVLKMCSTLDFLLGAKTTEGSLAFFFFFSASKGDPTSQNKRYNWCLSTRLEQTFLQFAGFMMMGGNDGNTTGLTGIYGF